MTDNIEMELNMQTRILVIENLLHIERLAKDLLRIIFRIFEQKTKTLGNTSNAISLKSKIDFLSDLNDIDDNEYKEFIKLMEIRNQFAHNSDAISFISLDAINPELNKYLKSKHSTLFIEDSDTELMLKNAFILSAKNCQKKLKTLTIEYNIGLQKEIKEKYTYRTILDATEFIKFSWKLLVNSNSETNLNISKEKLKKIGDSLVKNLEQSLKNHDLQKGAEQWNEDIKKVLTKEVSVLSVKAIDKK